MSAALPELVELFESLEVLWGEDPAPEADPGTELALSARAPTLTITQPANPADGGQPAIGRRVRELRMRIGWPIIEAAFRAGLEPITWWGIEKGKLDPAAPQLAVIAAALKTPATSLTG